MEKHLFAGASTFLGFIDFFEYVMPLEHAKKRYYLKGSSGSGKNTFLRKIVAEHKNNNNLIELFHCANDPNSLDAIAIPSLGFSVMDATPPHSNDPQIPIAIDKIIDFAQFIDEKKISAHTALLKQLFIEKRNSRKKINDYLTSLHRFYLEEYPTPGEDIISMYVQRWAKKITERHIKGHGKDRKLFLSAITPDGFITFVHSYFCDTPTVYGLGNSYVTNGIFLEKLKKQILKYGINTESFYNPFNPTAMEHLYLPDLGIAFVSTGLFGSEKEVAQEILPTLEPTSYTNGLFERLLVIIVDLMKESNAIHDQIEKLYIEAMDFDKLNQLKLPVMS